MTRCRSAFDRATTRHHMSPAPVIVYASSTSGISDSCDATAGCQHPAEPDGTSCSDGLTCNGDELCTGGVCDPGTPLCDDGDPCTTDACDEVTGCSPTDLPDGASCADATVCNGDETCQGGTCTP